MKHVKKWNEELSWKDMLKQQSDTRKNWEKSKEEEIEELRRKSSGYKEDLLRQSNTRKIEDEIIEDRKLLTQRVIEGILLSEKGKSHFKSQLIALLNEHGL